MVVFCTDCILQSIYTYKDKWLPKTLLTETEVMGKKNVCLWFITPNTVGHSLPIPLPKKAGRNIFDSFSPIILSYYCCFPISMELGFVNWCYYSWAPVFFFFFFFLRIFFFFNALFTLFIYLFFWLCWVFVSVRGLSLVVASGGHSSSWCAGLSLSRGPLSYLLSTFVICIPFFLSVYITNHPFTS